MPEIISHQRFESERERLTNQYLVLFEKIHNIEEKKKMGKTREKF